MVFSTRGRRNDVEQGNIAWTKNLLHFFIPCELYPDHEKNNNALLFYHKRVPFFFSKPVTRLALFNTSGHPKFPAAHAVNGAAVASMLTDVLSNNFHFTLNTYDYLGLPARNYNSFYEMGKEMADSRVFGGIHYQASCDKSRWLGEKVVKNILGKLKFKK